MHHFPKATAMGSVQIFIHIHTFNIVSLGWGHKYISTNQVLKLRYLTFTSRNKNWNWVNNHYLCCELIFWIGLYCSILHHDIYYNIYKQWQGSMSQNTEPVNPKWSLLTVKQDKLKWAFDCEVWCQCQCQWWLLDKLVDSWYWTWRTDFKVLMRMYVVLRLWGMQDLINKPLWCPLKGIIRHYLVNFRLYRWECMNHTFSVLRLRLKRGTDLLVKATTLQYSSKQTLHNAKVMMQYLSIYSHYVLYTL